MTYVPPITVEVQYREEDIDHDVFQASTPFDAVRKLLIALDGMCLDEDVTVRVNGEVVYGGWLNNDE